MKTIKTKLSLILITAVVLFAVSVSGCMDTGNSDNGQTDGMQSNISQMVQIADKNIPSGFTYLGSPSKDAGEIREDYADVSGIVDAAESIYKNLGGTEVHITAVELEDSSSAQNFIKEYKSGFKPLNNSNRFLEKSFNNHTATQITKYIIEGGNQVPRYTYTWNNKSIVFIVEGNTDDYTVTRQFSEATGY
ncbi:conserved hypothetical protein [Methanohalobium evestigatum Z-7303]|uniref:Lipoprotein n=1 Tax=Methanohalobium evestigatum (strain ATCC BAA-1072 / DSM 3721 / NBRC 107634 / OCM 161 / Z-7303) TaxID=644295 RepID=D7EB72_METEZ|nr:hypothetical protein [Methanohalobium evestigatum]ADI74589.1 conserved hypothetical protein [Methanohalobium evestigatum Z-7303]